MDIERPIRAELIGALLDDFACVEHVPLRHALFTDRIITCDVLAIPRDDRFSGLTIAFEVKCAESAWCPSAGVTNVPFWTRAIKQAADYVYAEVVSDFDDTSLHGRRIAASFVYPANIRRNAKSTEHDIRAWGAFEAACHLRVGRAYIQDILGGRARCLNLYLGTELWSTGKGFSSHANGVLRGRRPLGSQQVDLLSFFPGIDVSLNQN